MKNYQCLYFDQKNHRFCLFTDDMQKIYFTYWHELKRHGIRYLNGNTTFQADIEKREDLPHSRGVHIREINLDSNIELTSCVVIKNRNISYQDFYESILSEKAIIFMGCIFEDIEIDKAVIPKSLCFIDCCFEGNFRLISCKLYGDLWLPNCTFNKHFSLKSTQVNGDVHLENADFSGLGGASFRGIEAENLYLDLGVKGGDDLFWLNEMVIPGVVSIGGEFKNEVQILYQQDRDEVLDKKPSIGSIIVGKELYEYEKANRTTIQSMFKIEDIRLSGELVIEHLISDELNMSGIYSKSIELNHLSITNDLAIYDCRTSSSMPESDTAVSLINSSVGRHLRVDRNDFQGKFDLSGTAVSEVTYFEDNKLSDSGGLNLHRFTTAKFLLHPVESLYGNGRGGIFKPRSFATLSEKDPRLLGDQYCALKHWLADAGKLEMEDVAFFYMRQCYHPRKLSRFLLGGIFGWGVRLSNIAISSILLIVLFAVGYLFIEPKATILTAFALSIQSFISSFFGTWTGYDPDGMIANVVTLESFIGVLFITVFIGAYIRKLLR